MLTKPPAEVKALDWIDALFVCGVSLTLVAIYLLAGLAWMLLALGIACIAAAVSLTNRQARRGARPEQ